MKLTPFADDKASVSIGSLTVENGTDKLALYGSLDITRDQMGLRQARELLSVMQAAVQALERMPDLQAQATEQVVAPKVVKNPFE